MVILYGQAGHGNFILFPLLMPCLGMRFRCPANGQGRCLINCGSTLDSLICLEHDFMYFRKFLVLIFEFEKSLLVYHMSCNLL